MTDRLQSIRAWLAGQLGGEDFVLAPASSDASFRRYFRVTTSSQSWIVMDAPPEFEDCRPFVRVAALLQAAGVRVPEVRRADFERGLLLLDDLGREPYLQRLHDGEAAALYEDALQTLVRMQRDADASTLAAYDETLLRREMELFPDWLLARHLGRPAGADERAVLERSFDFLIEAACAQPQVFVHRDYHSRNLMVLAERNPGVLDFQDAVRGPLTYDLVSLLRDAYVRWPASQVAAWLSRYHGIACEAGLPLPASPAQLRRDFDLIGVQRHLKVAGIFARLFHRDGKPGYLADIPLVLDYLLEVAAHYRELAPLVALCERRGLKAAVLAANRSVMAGAPARDSAASTP